MPQKAEGLLTLRDGHSAEDEVVIVAASRVQDLVTSILIRKGATDDDAIAQAALLVEGDLRGRHSHGIRRLPVLVGRLRNGLVALWERACASVADRRGARGRRGVRFGPVIANVAIGRA